MPAEQLIMFAYFTLFELRGATPGKRACRLRVAMDGGAPVTPVAAITRNVVRVPELMLYYVPSVLSFLVSPTNKRLGDVFAHTVVIRQDRRPAVEAAGALAGAASSAQGPHEPPAGGPLPGASGDARQALTALKTAALAAYGAHLSYLRYQNAELEADRAAREAAGSVLEAGEDEPAAEREYSPEYVAAWHTLAETVAALRRAWPAAAAAAAGDSTTLDALTAGQPDLAALLRELEPYLGASTSEQIHAACLRVARNALS